MLSVWLFVYGLYFALYGLLRLFTCICLPVFSKRFYGASTGLCSRPYSSHIRRRTTAALLSPVRSETACNASLSACFIVMVILSFAACAPASVCLYFAVLPLALLCDLVLQNSVFNHGSDMLYEIPLRDRLRRHLPIDALAGHPGIVSGTPVLMSFRVAVPTLSPPCVSSHRSPALCAPEQT